MKAPETGLFSSVLGTVLPYGIVVIPQGHRIRIRVVIRPNESIMGKDTAGCIIGSEQKLLTGDGFLEFVFLQKSTVTVRLSCLIDKVILREISYTQ